MPSKHLLVLGLFLGLSAMADKKAEEKKPEFRSDEAALIEAVKKNGAKSADGGWSPALCEITRDWAKAMASRYRVSTSPTGHDGFARTPNSRSERALASTQAMVVSEVLAATYGFEKTESEHANSCVLGWLESPSHRREVMSKHDNFCFSMAKGGDGKYYCAGIFTDNRK